MKGFANLIFSVDFVYSIFRVMTPLLFASMGAVISDIAGVPNIALEGLMLMAALRLIVWAQYFDLCIDSGSGIYILSAEIDRPWISYPGSRREKRGGRIRRNQYDKDTGDRTFVKRCYVRVRRGIHVHGICIMVFQRHAEQPWMDRSGGRSHGTADCAWFGSSFPSVRSSGRSVQCGGSAGASVRFGEDDPVSGDLDRSYDFFCTDLQKTEGSVRQAE